MVSLQYSLPNINTVCILLVIATNITWCSSDFISIPQPTFHTVTPFYYFVSQHASKKNSDSSKASTNTPYVVHALSFEIDPLNMLQDALVVALLVKRWSNPRNSSTTRSK